MAHKYKNELHANEIVLLAYYIAAINIEEAFHSLAKEQDASSLYVPFEGIVLTDTFQLSEGASKLDGAFPENNKRAARQNGMDIRVVIGNPPYSAQQDSENDGNKNLKYPHLDERIRSTYAQQSSATLVKNLYDSYIRAIRWSSDRVKDKGIVCFVTNGSFIDANNMDGLRACLTQEFSSAYVFNLRGNARTSGEQRRMEKGNVFGEGTRTPVAITILVKNPEKTTPGQLFYHDIGDYLSKEEKLKIITEFGSMASVPWRTIQPNDSHDWINQRDPAFDAFMPLGDKTDSTQATVFETYSQGILTARDTWAYGFSRKALAENMARMIGFYNEQVDGFKKFNSKLPAVKAAERQKRVEGFIDTNQKKISWTRSTKNAVGRGANYPFKPDAITTATYRPFSKQWLYFNRQFNEMVYQMPKIFPTTGERNLVICVSGIGASKGFSALITDAVPNYHFHDTGQCFPLYSYSGAVADDDSEDETADRPRTEEMFAVAENQSELVKQDNISDATLEKFRQVYAKGNGKNISKGDIFYYVYGVLHSPEYKKRFDSDLKKVLPRIPFARDFWAFSKAGRALAEWHLNYETVEPYPLTQAGELDLGDPALYRVEKMQWGKIAKEVDKTTIIFNSRLRLGGIPAEVLDYVVNGKSALEWVMERYQVTVDHKESGIRNDPNDWATEVGDPAYVLNLVKRVVRVSLETVKIVKSLPHLSEIT